MGDIQKHAVLIFFLTILLIPAVRGAAFQDAQWKNSTFLELSMDSWTTIPQDNFHAYNADKETRLSYCHQKPEECRPLWRLALESIGITDPVLGWYKNENEQGECDTGVCSKYLSENEKEILENQSFTEYCDTAWSYPCSGLGSTYTQCMDCISSQVTDCEYGKWRWEVQCQGTCSWNGYTGIQPCELLDNFCFDHRQLVEVENTCTYQKNTLTADDLSKLYNKTRCWIHTTQMRESGNDYIKHVIVEGKPSIKDDHISCLIGYSDWQNKTAHNGKAADQIGPESKTYFDFEGNNLSTGVECEKNSDCGENYWTGEPECCNGDGWSICTAYHGYECRNPGTQESFCFEYDGYKQTEECFWECKDNKCGEKPAEPEEPACENSTQSCCTDSNCANYCYDDFHYFNGYCPGEGEACWHETTHCSASDGQYCSGTILETRDYYCEDGCEYNVTSQAVCPYGCENGECKSIEPALKTITCKDEKTLQYHERNKTGENYTDWKETGQALCLEGETCIGPVSPDEAHGIASCVQLNEPVNFAIPIICETHENCPFKYMACIQGSCIPTFRLFEDFDFDQPSDMINPLFVDRQKLEYLGLISQVYKPVLGNEITSQIGNYFELRHEADTLNKLTQHPNIVKNKLYFGVLLYDDAGNQLREVDMIRVENGKIVEIAEPTIQVQNIPAEITKFENIAQDIKKTKSIEIKRAQYSFESKDGKINPVKQPASPTKITVNDDFRNSINYKKTIPTTWDTKAARINIEKALLAKGIEPNFLLQGKRTDRFITLYTPDGKHGVYTVIYDKKSGKWQYMHNNPHLSRGMAITPGQIKPISADDYAARGSGAMAAAVLDISYKMMSYYSLYEGWVGAQEFQKEQHEMCGTDPENATSYYNLKAAGLLKQYKNCEDCDELIMGAELENFFFYYFQDICTKELVGQQGPDYQIPDSAESIKELYQIYVNMPLQDKCFKTLYFDLNGKVKPDSALTTIKPSENCEKYTLILPIYQKQMYLESREMSQEYMRSLRIETNASFKITSPEVKGNSYTLENQDKVHLCLKKPYNAEETMRGIYTVEITPLSEEFTVQTKSSLDQFLFSSKCFEAPKPKITAVSSGGGGGGGGSGSSAAAAPAPTPAPAAGGFGGWTGDFADESTPAASTAAPQQETQKTKPANEKPKETIKQEPQKTVLFEQVKSIFKKIFSWLHFFI